MDDHTRNHISLKRRRASSPPDTPESPNPKRQRRPRPCRAASVEHPHRVPPAFSVKSKHCRTRCVSEPPLSNQAPSASRQSCLSRTSQRALTPDIHHFLDKAGNQPQQRRRSCHDELRQHSPAAYAGDGCQEPTPDTSSPTILDTSSRRFSTTTSSAPRTPRTPLSPSALLHFGDILDPRFGEKVTQAFQFKEALANFSHSRRIDKYGCDVAEAYSPGRTPSPEREAYHKAQQDGVAAYWEDLRTGSPDYDPL